MATLYTTDGIEIEVKPKGESFSYEELKMIVGGLVEIVPLPDGRSMVVNEEGKLIGLPKNEEATKMWNKQYPIEDYSFNNDELVVGNALVATDKELGE
jgi:hypothetical protein